MGYNIVNIRNRWLDSGLLRNTKTIQQQIELGKLLDGCNKILQQMIDNHDMPDWFNSNSSEVNIPFYAVAEIYDMIHTRRYISSEVAMKRLAENLKADEHKIDVRDVIEKVLDKCASLTSKDFASTLGSYEYEMAKHVSESYLIENGAFN